MPKIAYREINFIGKSAVVIQQANTILEEYMAQGYRLTLRQLYYQFVSRGLLANKVQNYKRLGSIVSDGRLAGLIDWNRIEDRTRGVKSVASWDSPEDIVNSCAAQFRIDIWENQPYAFEVWIEKEALAGVLERVCTRLRVPYLSCKGYTSMSEMWEAGQRMIRYHRGGKLPVILHLGDHDPSGIDMTRDIQERLAMFCGGHGFAAPKMERLALNMDQIEQYNPPPNPAKETDSRFASYVELYGDESWELDALEPQVLNDLVDEAVRPRIEFGVMKEKKKEENRHRATLKIVSENWDAIEERYQDEIDTRVEDENERGEDEDDDDDSE